MDLEGQWAFVDIDINIRFFVKSSHPQSLEIGG